MQSVQESKQELEAAIRYAENAISSAQGTIESMEFRQEMAKKNYQEQTGREKALERDLTVKTSQAEAWKKEYEKAKEEADELRSKVQGQYDDIVQLERESAQLHKEVEFYTKKYNELVKQKEASSGPCGCQAYRDLEEFNAELSKQNVSLAEGKPTMPVIPKAVAIAIFREGMQHGVEAACSEIDNTNDIEINETEYAGGFEVSFTKYFDLSEHLDTDWMRDKVGDYSEEFVIDALGTLCADNKFECRIHGVDDQEEKNAN